MTAVMLALFAIAMGLATTMPFLSPKSLGGLALGLALAALALIAFRGFRDWSRPARVGAGLLCLAEGLFFVLAGPLGPRHRYNQDVVPLLLLMIGTLSLLHLQAEGFNAWVDRAAGRLHERRWAEGLAISTFSVLLLLGAAEFLAAALARTRLVPFDRPLQTFHRGQPVVDWRRFHITEDRNRVPDPHLLWRPVAFEPYNSKGYKAPEFAVAKPAGTFRIITLGDSNTDGPDRGGWPDELRRLLASQPRSALRFEVINAGVVGYSSFQGLRRMEECLRYEPDLVMVSFGANDAHLVVAGPDKTFALRRPALVPVMRVLYRYKAFLLARYLALRWSGGVGAIETPLEPRVSVPDYEVNLERMVALARGAGARAVLLTRPHDPAKRRTAPPGYWIERAAEYNEATARVGRRLRVPVFDAYALFEGSGPDAFADESHFTLLGHARMGQLLRDFLAREGLLPAPSAAGPERGA